MDDSEVLKNNIGNSVDLMPRGDLQFSNIIDIIIEGISINDSAGKIIYINKGFEKLLGYQKKKF